MDQREIEDLIIDLLAQDAGRSAEDLRREIEEGGENLPIDSLLAAEVLARVEVRCGISYPATAEGARNLGSVTDFAKAILDLMQTDDAATGVTA